MAGYTRFWTCVACDKRQETIDYPDVDICDRCLYADQDVKSAQAELQVANRRFLNAMKRAKDKYRAPTTPAT